MIKMKEQTGEELDYEYLNNRIDRMFDLIGIHENRINAVEFRTWDKEKVHEQIGFDNCLRYLLNLTKVTKRDNGDLDELITQIRLIQRDRECSE